MGIRRGAGITQTFAGKTRLNYTNLLKGAAVAPSPAIYPAALRTAFPHQRNLSASYPRIVLTQYNSNAMFQN